MFLRNWSLFASTVTYNELEHVPRVYTYIDGQTHTMHSQFASVGLAQACSNEFFYAICLWLGMNKVTLFINLFFHLQFDTLMLFVLFMQI